MKADNISNCNKTKGRLPTCVDRIWTWRERLVARFPRTAAFCSRYGIWLIVAVFFLLYAAGSLLKHMNFNSYAWDLGIFDQAIWKYSRLEIGSNTVKFIPVLLADHWHPSLFLFVPFYWIWEDVRMLLIVQALVAASCAIPIYLIAREKLRDRFAAQLLAVTCLFFWGMWELVFFDFHPYVLFPFVLSWMYYFVMRDNMIAYFLLLPLLLNIQEQMALAGVFFGIYLVIFKRKWFAGIATFIISSTWFYLISEVLIPALSPSGTTLYVVLYSHMGNSGQEIIRYLLTHPHMALKQLFWPLGKLHLLFMLLVPFLLLPLLGGFCIVLIPDLLLRLYSNNPELWGIHNHYNAVYAAVLVISFLEALPGLYRWLKRTGRYPSLSFRKLAFTLCLVILVLQVPFTLRSSFTLFFHPSFYSLDARERAGYRVLSDIPAEASVSAQYKMVSHLSQRELIYLLDGNYYSTEYVIVNRYFDYFPFPDQEGLEEQIDRLYQDPRYEVTDYGEGWLVFHIKPQYDVDAPRK
jgi:uncharacterized membrane protein